MIFDSHALSCVIATICIFSFKYFVLLLFPFSELMRTMRALFSEKNNNPADDSSSVNNNSNDATSTSHANINANADAINNNASTNSASNVSTTSTPADTKVPSSLPSSPSSSLGYVSAAPIPFSSSYESLTATVKNVQEQSIAAALDLADKIDYLKQENQALNAHIVALQNQLTEEKSRADNLLHTTANRIDILERYVQNDLKFEDQRKHEVQEVQVLSQRNTDLINERINAVEDQLTKLFEEFEDRRSKELQSFATTFKSLRKRCDEFKVELDKQIQQTASQTKDTAMNTATIKETLASNALGNLGKSVRDAMDLCESKLNKVEAEREMLQFVAEDRGEELKILLERVVALETEFDDMREEVRNGPTEMSGSIDSMEQDIHHIVREMGVQLGVLDTHDKSPQETIDVTDETY
ncbi:uncharacterized protein ATC70_009792 [Mucor velutinosus]|uniref:Uncharacterized protein n=1 Tax=Mucor velutinosus TaxID=708070 RepID=A0AAN7DLG1_9FUNG|nr:hypothetical protein ATC70_009792 [Mucor velutinosus]